MTYDKFTIDLVKEKLEIELTETNDMFAGISPVKPSELCQGVLERYVWLALPMGTDKAKSELILAPLLAELREQMNHQVSLFSGNDFTVDRKAGLSGCCDFIVCASPSQLSLQKPILIMVEARKDNINRTLGHCIAQMVAAQRLNQREGYQTKTIFGGVTNGSNWRFLRLEANQLCIDRNDYYINSPEKILGVLVHITKIAAPSTK